MTAFFLSALLVLILFVVVVVVMKSTLGLLRLSVRGAIVLLVLWAICHMTLRLLEGQRKTAAVSTRSDS